MEKKFARRQESAWPIPRTQYTKYYLTPDNTLTTTEPIRQPLVSKLSYKALGTLDTPQLIQFRTSPVSAETEITGHITARLCVSAHGQVGGNIPRDIDLFVTLRHISSKGKEVYYTGTAGDPVPLCKGWLRVSLRKVNKEHARRKSSSAHI